MFRKKNKKPRREQAESVQSRVRNFFVVRKEGKNADSQCERVLEEETIPLMVTTLLGKRIWGNNLKCILARRGT